MQAEWEELARRNWLTENDQQQIPSNVSPYEKVKEKQFKQMIKQLFIYLFIQYVKPSYVSTYLNFPVCKTFINCPLINYFHYFLLRDTTSTQIILSKTGQMHLRRDYASRERENCLTPYFFWKQLCCRTLRIQR